MSVCSYNLKLNNINSPRFNICPIPCYNIDVNRVSDAFFAKMEQQELEFFITYRGYTFFVNFLTAESVLVFGNSDWNR